MGARWKQPHLSRQRSPPVVALVLAGVFLGLAQEPAMPPETKQ